MSTIANSIASAAQTASTGTAASTSATPTDPLASESTFLTLLVSQLQNQDPLSPVDSNQFVSQLTQYSQLEQLIGIHSDTTSLATTAAPASSAPASATAPMATPAASASVLPEAVRNQQNSIQTGVN